MMTLFRVIVGVGSRTAPILERIQMTSTPFVETNEGDTMTRPNLLLTPLKKVDILTKHGMMITPDQINLW